MLVEEVGKEGESAQQQRLVGMEEIPLRNVVNVNVDTKNTPGAKSILCKCFVCMYIRAKVN